MWDIILLSGVSTVIVAVIVITAMYWASRVTRPKDDHSPHKPEPLPYTSIEAQTPGQIQPPAVAKTEATPALSTSPSAAQAQSTGLSETDILIVSALLTATNIPPVSNGSSLD